MNKMTKADLIRNYDKEHPGATAAEVAKALKLHPSYVWLIRSSDKKKSKQAVKVEKPASQPTNGQMVLRSQFERVLQENDALKNQNEAMRMDIEKLSFLVSYLETKVKFNASV